MQQFFGSGKEKIVKYKNSKFKMHAQNKTVLWGAKVPGNVILIIMLLISAIIGTLAVFQFSNSPFFNLPILDEESYVTWAEQIAHGEIIGHTVFYQDPLYPYFLAFLFRILGRHLLVVRVVQVILGTASIGVVYWTARKLMGDTAGLIAAGIMVFYRGLYFFEILILKATLVLFLSSLSCALGVAAVHVSYLVSRESYLVSRISNYASRDTLHASRFTLGWRWLGLGISLGLLTLLRGNFLPILPLVILWSFFLSNEITLSERVRRALSVTAGIGLIIIPVSVRNYAVGGEFVLTTSQGGANFYIGNNSQANGRYVTLPFVRADPQFEAADFKTEAERRVGYRLKPSQVSAFWFKDGLSWINKNKSQAAKLWLHKARLMIHQYEIPDNHSFYLIRDLFVPIFRLTFVDFGLLWGPALIGIFISLRKDIRSSYPALFAMLYCLSIIPFFIVDRYRVAAAPAAIIFSAFFVVWAMEKWKTRQFVPLGISGVFLGATLLLGFLPTTESRSRMCIEYYLLGNAYLKTGKPALAIPYYERALKVLPDDQGLIYNWAEAMRQVNSRDLSYIEAEAGREDIRATELIELGKQAEELGQLNLAVEIYERAAAKDAETFSAHARLGFLYTTRPEVKNPIKALAHLKKALEIKPESLDTMNALGDYYFLSENSGEARHWWEEVLKRQPDNEAAKKNLKSLAERINQP